MYCIHKKSLILAGVLLLIVSLFILTALLQNRKQTISSKASPRLIYGGTEVPDISKYPFMAALLHPNDIEKKNFADGTFEQYDLLWAPFCAGTFISEDVIVTAAHCVNGITDLSDIVVLGNTRSLLLTIDHTDYRKYFFSVDDIVIHEGFRGRENMSGSLNDIALLHLSRPNTQISAFPHIPKVSQNEQMYADANMTTALGWGEMENGKYPINLREVDLPIIRNSKANWEHWYDGAIADTMMAAGYTMGERDTCSGDSGGPLLYKQGDVHYLLGITSWGDQCGLLHRPGIYTRVISYEDWIQSKMMKFDDKKRLIYE